MPVYSHMAGIKFCFELQNGMEYKKQLYTHLTYKFQMDILEVFLLENEKYE